MKILILRTAPIEQISLSLSFLRKRFESCAVSCVCQPEAREVIGKKLAVNDFIAYPYLFFKLHKMVSLLFKVRKRKYDGIAFFYNNLPRKGYAHLEWFVLLTGIALIFLCDEDGTITEFSRGKFLQFLLIKCLNILGNGFVFLVVCFLFALAIPYSAFRNQLKGVKK